MSNSKKIRSKRRFRKARVRKGRHVLTVDIETRSAAEIGTRVHREIERVLMCGDAHVGISEAIAHALHGYAEHYPADVVVVGRRRLLATRDPRQP